MSLQLCPPSDPDNIIDLCAGPEVNHAHLRAELDNIVAGLARFYGVIRGQEILAQAFAEAFAGWAADGGRPALSRFALEASLDGAMAREAFQRAPRFRPLG